MKKLRLIQSGYEDYTGPIGAYDFVNGESVEVINRPDRDRLSVAFQFEEIDAEGNAEPAGIAHRLISERDKPAEVREPLERQTEDEKRAELVAEVLKSDVPPDTHTLEELHKIMDTAGIAGLREIAAVWNVKHRSAVVLIQMIMDKQKAYLALRQLKLAQKVAAEMPDQGEPAAIVIDGPIVADVIVPGVIVTEVIAQAVVTDPAMDAVKDAAMTGDFAAAIKAD